MSGRLGDPGTRPAPFFDHGLFLLHLNRGKENLRKGQFDDARLEFEEARRFRGQDPEVLSNLALSLFHLGHLDDAERITRSLLSSHAESVPLLFNLGLILYKAGRPEAREPLERVLALAPNHRKAHLTLGLVLQRDGQTERAARHLRIAGAERKAGIDGDDTISRTARAAVAARPGPAPPAAVKPELFESGEEGGPQKQKGPKTEPILVIKPRPAETEPPAAEPSGSGEPTAPILPVAPAAAEGGAQAAEEPSGGAVAPAAGHAKAATAPRVPPPSEDALAMPVPAPTGSGPSALRSTAPRSGELPRPVLGHPVPFASRGAGMVVVDCRGGVLVRRTVLAGRTGGSILEADTLLGGPLAGSLARATGEGSVLLLDVRRQLHLVHLRDDFLSADPGRLLGFEASLGYREDPAFEFRRQIELPFLKLLGTGVVALASSGTPARLEVTVQMPVTVAVRSLLAWGGDLDVDLVEEEDPLAELGAGPAISFAGNGYLLIDA